MNGRLNLLHLSLVAMLGLAACAPAAPAPPPTSAPAKPAATAAPAPTAAPAAKPTVPPAAKPAATTAPAAKPTAQAAAKPAFDEKAVAEFYKGKTVRVIVPYAAGGGADAYSRNLARHMGKHVPGNPSIIVENVTGAGGLIGVNQVYNIAAKDGTVVGNVFTVLLLQQLFGAKGVEFDATKMKYLGVMASDNYLLIVTKGAGVTKMDDILGPGGKQVVVGSTPPGDMTYNAPALVREALGANIKLVSGYDGTSKIRLAMESGEVQGMSSGWESVKLSSLDKVKGGEWLLLAQLNEQPLKDLPDVPGILSFAKNDEQRQLLRFGVIVPAQFSRLYFLAPEVPADRSAALEAAFMKTLADKEFLAEAEKARQDIAPIDGATVQKRLAELFAMPASIKSRLQKALQPAS